MTNSKNSHPTIKLYHYWRSSCSWRVRWALNHKGIPYEEETVNLLSGEQKSSRYLTINPQGFVPALAVNGEIFGESMAMLEWIEETYPKKPLLPNSPQDRMRVRQICQMIVSGTQPLQNLVVMKHHSSDTVEQQAWSKHWIANGLEKLEVILSSTSGSHCLGGQLTFADLCLVPQVYNARRFGIDPMQYPTIHRLNNNLTKLADCIAASPEMQIGATK